MNKIKHLNLTLAILSALTSTSLLADQNTDQANEQENIDTLVKRLDELEKKLQIINYKDDQQPAILTPETPVQHGIVFSGYARYGANFQNSDAKTVRSHGSSLGNATGRLGNEQNGGEYQFAKVFEGANNTKWDLVFMVDHWADREWADDGGVQVKKMYAGATNIFESQPDLYVWAGRDFHQRPQFDINDYFWMMHDGQGFGFYNLNIDELKFDLSAVAQVDDDMVGDNGRYAITSKLSNITIGDSLDLAFYANYGFSSDQIKKDEEGSENTSSNAYQIAAEGKIHNQHLVVRYSSNAVNSTFDLADGVDALLFSLEGNFKFTDKIGLQYLTSYQDVNGAKGTYKVSDGSIKERSLPK
ncbi:carbohydrate porin [Psychromonas sp. MME1]|uniref:carbohydrate porin n=1 Tax=Psychromonas sp. MME1 TaxID=3231032 RepID=UPI0034E22838